MVVASGCSGFFGPDSDSSSVILAFSVQGQGGILVDGQEEIEVEKGTVINLTAEPDEGWEFKEWIGDVSEKSSPSTSILMDEDKSVTAVFEEEETAEPEEYDLTIDIDGEGSTDPAEGVHTYEDGEEVTVTATPDTGWVFDGWSGDSDSSDSEITITMDGNKSIVANFVEDEDEDDPSHDLGISIERTDDLSKLEYEIMGTSDPAVNFFDFYVDGSFVGGDGSSNYTSDGGDIVHEFDSSKENQEVNITLKVLDEDENELATKTQTFTLGELDQPDPAEEYDLTIDIDGEGSTDPAEGVHTYDDGEEVTVTATPDTGWVFDGWSGDSTSSDSEITITMDEDKSIVANFVEDEDEDDPSDPEVYFTYEQVDSLKYEFTATEPDGAKYWEWKFPSKDYWEGYEGINEIEHEFESSGDKEIKLRIFDDNEDLIGEYQKTITVEEGISSTVTLTINTENGGSVNAEEG